MKNIQSQLDNFFSQGENKSMREAIEFLISLSLDKITAENELKEHIKSNFNKIKMDFPEDDDDFIYDLKSKNKEV